MELENEKARQINQYTNQASNPTPEALAIAAKVTNEMPSSEVLELYLAATKANNGVDLINFPRSDELDFLELLVKQRYLD